MAAKSDGAAVCESASRCLLGPEQSAAPVHPRTEKRFSLLDCCWVLCALLVFFSDGATDLWLAADYYLRRDYWWFGLTLVFVVVPSAVVQVLSFRWFVYDYSEMSASPNGDGCDFSTKDSDRRSGSGRTLPANGTRKCCRVLVWLFQSIIHILQLGQVWSDCFFGPLYISSPPYWKGQLDVIHHNNQSIFEDVTILTCIYVFQLYFGIFIVAHWCAMTFWIIQGETDFCMSKWEEIIYNMVVGIIYIFCWFNVKEGRARFRLGVYYSVTLVENVALTAAWYIHRGPHTSDFYALIIVCVVLCSYALGTFFMFVYYCLLHPDGPILGAQWSCVEEGMGVISLGGVGDLGTPLPQPDVVTSPPRTLQRTTAGDREIGAGDRDSCLPVFQVRPPSVPPASFPRPPRTEGPVIRIDLPRKSYPAWDAHFIDRRLRKTILVLENTSPVTPRIQYQTFSNPKEVTEYETTV
uniref:XK-related protein n=1 Tax=Cyprinus carpio TaxID=7962 RepID=A0A8C1NDR9_CYPCA